jgi:hypothetical protein
VYWKWSLVPQAWIDMGHSPRLALAIFWVLTVALAAFSVRQIAKGRYSVLFCLAWFVITLAPMIPLPAHRTDYYLTIPLIGLALLAGLGISQAVRAAWVWRVAAVAVLVAYLEVMIPSTGVASRWWLERSLAVRGLVLGVAAAQKAHPGKTVVLDGITSDLYDTSIGDSAFTSVGLAEAYLTPASGDTIHPANDFGKLAHVVMDRAALSNAITHEQVVIYSYVGDHLRNITGVWERLDASNRLSGSRRSDQVPRRIELGNSLLAYLLGPEWLPLEPGGFRWMPARATVRMGGPASSGDKLLLEGYCPDQQLQAGPLHIALSVDGMALEGAQIERGESSFRRLLAVPPSLAGRESVGLTISVDRVLHEPGGRQLGLVFVTIAWEK